MTPPACLSHALTTREAIDAAREIVRRGLPAQTFWQWLHARLDEACDAFDQDPAHACAPVDFAMSCGQSILGLLQCDEPDVRDVLPRIGHSGVSECGRMMKRLAYRYRARLARRPYRPQECGEPPYRDHAHGALRVTEASPLSAPTRTGRVHAYAEVEPFVDHRLRKRVRAGLYHQRLQARRLGPADIQSPGERALVGQWGVFATAAIPPGTCVGAYGGLLMRRPEAQMLGNWEHVLWIPSGEGIDSDRVWLNGDNILSLVNTFMQVDADGRFLGHPEADYNVAPARFPATFSHGWKAGVIGLFALRDIAPGEELRWNYGWEIAPAGSA